MPEPIVKIDGVTVEAVPQTLSIQSTLGNRAGLNVDVWSADGSYRPVTGKDIEIFEGATKLWAGSIDEVWERSISEASPTGRRYSLRGVSWEQYLDRRYCYDTADGRPIRYSRNFEFTADAGTDTITATTAHGRSNGDRVRVKAHAVGALCAGLSDTIEYFVISAAPTTLQLSLTAGGAAVDITDTGTLEQILITHRAGELVALLLTDAATSEPLGTTNIDLGAVIDSVIWDSDVTVSTAIGQLAEASNYVWWIDEERELFFKPRTYTTAPFSLTSGGGNYRNFSVRRTREEKTNAVLMRVDLAQIGYENETFVGDGSATTWTLAHPVGEIVKIQVNDEDKEFAIWLAEADRAYYYELGGDVIRQDADETILTAAETLRVIYRKFGANTIYESDSTDISTTATLEGNSGIYQRPYERPGIGQLQASAEGRAIIEGQKSVVSEVQYETDQVIETTCHTLRPGQLQTIANSYHDVASATYLIREVSLSDVGGLWLRFSVRAISTSRLPSSIDFWKAVMGGTGGGGMTSGFSGGATTGTGGGSTNIEYTLVANTAIASPYTPTEADILTIYVTQGAGPYVIAFDSDFHSDFNTNLPGKDGAVTVFQFRGRSDGKWWLLSAPFSVLYD